MNQANQNTNQDIKLNNCNEEAIHLPGFIQPHGVILVLKEPELTILQVSNNCLDILDIPSCELINDNLNILLQENQIQEIKKYLCYHNLSEVNPIRLSIFRPDKTLNFDGIIHRNDGVVILELEPPGSQIANEFLSFYNLIRASASKIQHTTSLTDLCNVIVKEIRQLTDFDRVMVYKFDSEENGQVIAEAKIENLPSFLGLNYPSLDIPKPARKLYTINWLRLIPDVNYQPVEIIPPQNPLTKRPLDLSFSVLRSVSPCHIEYLQNMNVGASMSISIIKNDKLWGLIACHHNSFKYVSYEVRKACEFLGQVMSLEIASKEENEDYEYRIKLKSVITQLIAYMSNEKHFINGLCQYQPNLLNIANAQGAVVYLSGNYITIGKTPQKKELKGLIKWLEDNFQGRIISTNFLTNLYKDAEKFKDVASGLLAISISQSEHNYIIWFRPEVIQTVNWAGNPEEVVNNENLRLSPRKSFELWKETVRLKSLPWKQCEIDAALELRNAIISIVLKKADELAKLNTALQESEAREREKANQLEKTLYELQRMQAQLIQSEKMSSLGQMVAGVAYEINNPVNFIYGNINHADNYSEDLIYLLNIYSKYYPQAVPEIQEAIEDKDIEFVKEDLPKLLKSMKVGVERIRDLVQSLRNFARLDESEMKAVNIHDGLDSTLLILSNRLKDKPEYPGIQVIKKYGDLPNVECYAAQLNQVFMNIITNAIDALESYNNQRTPAEIKANPAKITIRTEVLNQAENQAILIGIADNGMGMSEEVKSRLFAPIYIPQENGKNKGIGLNISYQIVVEKHRGSLRCISELQQGTEFLIEIPVNYSREGEKGNRE